MPCCFKYYRNDKRGREAKLCDTVTSNMSITCIGSRAANKGVGLCISIGNNTLSRTKSAQS
jgi:hypothetical protein